MHEPRPIPRRENDTKSFDDDLIARTLSNAANIRRTLRFSRGDLFLDAEGRRSNPEQAAQASTDGRIRLASMALCPEDSLDARDLRWHATTRFQRRIGCGIETYDNDPNNTAETVADDLEKTAAEVMNPAARYTAEALEKAGHPEAAEQLYYILKELADDPDEVPVSQESMAHLAGFIATTTLPHGATISIGPDGNASVEWHFTGPPEHGAKTGILAIVIHQDATIQIAGISAPVTEPNRTRVSGRFSKPDQAMQAAEPLLQMIRQDRSADWQDRATDMVSRFLPIS